MAGASKPEVALADNSEGVSEQTPRKTSAFKKAGSKLKKAFTPRKHNAGSEDAGDQESLSSEGSDKKKPGFFRKLSQKVRTPRGKEFASRAEAGDAAGIPEEIPEEKAKEEASAVPAAGGIVQGVAGVVADSKPAEGGKGVAEELGAVKDAAKDKVEEGKWEMVEAAGQAKAEGPKGAEAAAEAVKGAVPETVIAAPASSVHTAAEPVSHEVEAAQVKAVAPVQQVVAATRDVELPKPAQEREAEEPVEAPNESKKSSGRRRRPLIPLLGIAVGIAVIAIRMAK